MTASTAPIKIKPGDWICHRKTGEVAQVVSVDVRWITLENESGRRNDPAMYWERTVCPEMGL